MGTIQPTADDFLSRILRDKQREVAARREAEPASRLAERAAAAAPPLPVVQALRAERLRVIAEVKRGSPSKGTFDAVLDAAAQAERYAAGGATAVSVLTDGPYFQGCLEDLRATRERVSVPLLRKDFIVDPYQLLEARAAGADLVLLIAAALQPEQLAALLTQTHALGMEALVEVHTEAEARLAAQLDVPLAGINNRDLHTFEVDMGTTERLRPLLPDTTVVASLSGIARVDDAVRMRVAGADAVLVGEALVRAADPGALLAKLNGVA